MKEKIVITVIAIIILIVGISTAIMIKNNKNTSKQNIIISEEPLTDECTEEYKIAQNNQESREVNSSDEKISLNSVLILKKYYKECGHTINEYVEMLPELINMTEDEVAGKFQDWELIGFSNGEVTLFKEIDGSCGEHFILKEEDGNIVIYKILPDGTKQIYEKTEISTEFLPETDLIQIRSEEGIKVYGKEELNKVLEDFE